VLEGIHTIRGVVASIKWGYYAAASINNYVVTIRRNPQTKARVWSVRATIVQAEPTNLRQRPLIFRALIGQHEWWWVIRTIRFEGADVPPARTPFSCTADLEAPELQAPGAMLYVVSTVPARSA
jgi:hypothetical protein